jgi:exocyst complex protein 7
MAALLRSFTILYIPDDVISTILSSLTTLSKANKRPAFGSIFLFNNVGFLLQRLVVAPQTLELPSMLSQATVDLLNSNFRIAKAGYFDSNFSPLLQALTEDPKETRGVIGTGKSSTKEKLTKFFDLLEEVSERHKMARVLEDGEYGREQIADEVVKLVVLSLQGFMQKHRDKSESLCSDV